MLRNMKERPIFARMRCRSSVLFCHVATQGFQHWKPHPGPHIESLEYYLKHSHQFRTRPTLPSTVRSTNTSLVIGRDELLDGEGCEFQAFSLQCKHRFQSSVQPHNCGIFPTILVFSIRKTAMRISGQKLPTMKISDRLPCQIFLGD